MSEQQLLVVGVVAAIVAVVALLLFRASQTPRKSRSSGPDPGGTFGGVPNIVPGIFDPGTAPPPTHEVTDHVRPYDDNSKPKEE